jgi:hypothetical protein
VSDTVVADSPTFHYVPPLAAHGAQRVIVKPNLGYPVPAPVTVGLPVLREVLLGIRRVAPRAEIVILEGVCTKVTFAEVMSRLGVNRLLAELADPGLRLLDADTLSHKAYSNTSRQPQRFDRMQAPALLEEADCRVSVAGFQAHDAQGTPAHQRRHQKSLRTLSARRLSRPQPACPRAAPRAGRAACPGGCLFHPWRTV